MYSSLLPALAASTSFFAAANAHSWVDMLRNIANNGSFTGEPGYPRGYHNHSAGGFDDKTMVYQVEAYGPNPSMCTADQQGGLPQTPGASYLQAAAGSMIALLYQENGHVSLPQNQPGKQNNSGTIYIYGTAQPKDNETFYDIHKVWNADGTGGDKRGKLLSTQNFDDGQCRQNNTGAIATQRSKEFPLTEQTNPEGGDLWCQNNLVLPPEAQAGKLYALYWVWDWPTAVGTPGQPNGLNQTYTTCMDIQITSGSANSKVATQIKYVPNPNIQGAALPSAIQKLAQGSNFYAQTTAINGGAVAPASASAPQGQATQPAAKPTSATAAQVTQSNIQPSSASGGSLAVQPVPLTSVAATSATVGEPSSAVAISSPAGAASSAGPAASVSVSIETVTIYTSAPAASKGRAAVTSQATAVPLSEAQPSGSSGPMVPAVAASAQPSSANTAASQATGAAGPSAPCKPSGAQKRSRVFVS